MKKPWEILHLPCFKTNIAIASTRGLSTALLAEVPWSFWSSPLLVLSALWITTAVISPTFQQVLFLWWILGHPEKYHRFVGRTYFPPAKKVVVSPLTPECGSLRAWLLGGVTYWEEGLELQYYELLIVASPCLILLPQKKMSLTPLGFRCPLKPNRCCQRQLLWGNFLGHVPFRTFSSDSRRSRCSSDS